MKQTNLNYSSKQVFYNFNVQVTSFFVTFFSNLRLSTKLNKKLVQKREYNFEAILTEKSVLGGNRFRSNIIMSSKAL